MRISSLRYDNSCRRFSEVQENVVSTLNRKILTSVVLVGWLNMLSRGIWYEQGMKKYIPLFCYCYQLPIVSTPRPAPITVKAATNFSDSE